MGDLTDKRRANPPLEANVLLEIRMLETMSEEVLDANSDDVLEAVEEHASEIALGPTISLNLKRRAIRLRFDVLAKDMAGIYKQIAKVAAVIEKHSDFSLELSRSQVEAQSKPATSEFAKL